MIHQLLWQIYYGPLCIGTVRSASDSAFAFLFIFKVDSRLLTLQLAPQ